MDQSDIIKDAVRDWFSREGTKVESISNPRAEFLFKVKFNRFFFTVVRPETPHRREDALVPSTSDEV